MFLLVEVIIAKEQIEYYFLITICAPSGSGGMEVKMKSFVFRAPGIFDIEDQPDPKINNNDDVLIKVIGMGICGTDMHIFEGKRKVKFPMTAGHEVVGNIYKTGPDVKNFRVGDYVTVSPNITCGTCEYCTSGHLNLCPEKVCMGLDTPGVFSEYIVIPEKHVYKLPKKVTVQQGIAVETATVSLHAVNKANIKIGDKVLIFGAGAVGNFAAQLAKISGGEVYVTDTNPFRLKIIANLGVTEKTYVSGVDQIPSEFFDVIIDAAGVAPTIRQSLNVVKKGGKIVFVGIPSKLIELDVKTIIRHELEIVGSVACINEFPEIIRLISSGQLNVDVAVTHTLQFDKLAHGIELMVKQEAIKPCVVF